MPNATVAVREHPVLFSGPMVRAILDGSKTQTRRVVKDMWDMPLPCGKYLPERPFFCESDETWRWMRGVVSNTVDDKRCTYGVPGDRLWVRETFAMMLHADGERVHYRADGKDPKDYRGNSLLWRPSIHMPRWASRLTLELTDVRAQRLQQISTLDIEAEGVCIHNNRNGARHYFIGLWDSLNAKRGYPWDSNPWVWALTFGRVDA